jgi:putative copper resistance protein D
VSAAFVAIRAVHFAATILVFGELVFASFVAGGAWRRAVAAAPDARARLDRHVRIVTAWAMAASAVSGVGWLVIEAADMAGTSIGRAVASGTPGIVLRQTEFGHAFLLRAVLFVVLAAALAWPRRVLRDNATKLGTGAALVLAALYLATLAGAGHAAAAAEGGLRLVHAGADALHLLAAGGWLGALPALAYCLAVAPSAAALARLVRRFSVLGIACVAILIASGVVNSLFLVGSFAALFGTPYGVLLIVKLGLFAVLLAVAAINRFRLTPRLASDDRNARRSLRRNAMIEIAGGAVIIAIVGALGTMVPGAHQSPQWPFSFALDFSGAVLTPATRGILSACVLLALVAIALIITGVHRTTFRVWMAGSVALLVSAIASTSLFAVPAFPTTFARSPVPYAVDAVARGASRFMQDCSGCHGADARGGGPAAAALPVKPPNLAEHALHHPQGNLFWWIAHGVSGTPMPAFSPQLSDRSIWELVQFLVARASAESAMSLGGRVTANSMSRVPDFTYEVPQQGQRALAGQRTPALVVLYTLPQSQRRLSALASDHRLMHADLRVIAIPLPDSRPAQTGDATNDPVETRVNPDVSAVYAMFAQESGGARAAHVEMLVDGAGVVRARWTDLPASDEDRDAAIAAAAQRVRASPAASRPMHHGH